MSDGDLHLRGSRPLDGSPVFPACLLVEDRDCLVVGGGRVGLRKVQHLLAARARVTVVAPTLCADLANLVSTGAVTHHARHYATQDVTGRHLVFATTDNSAVNRTVLAACQRERIWCNLADKYWTRGEFVTPAVLRQGELTVGISTGGRSCRRSRLVRNNLLRHLAITDRAKLLVIGTDHRHLDQQRREALQPDADGITRLGMLVMQVWGVHEFLLLVTCNRIELCAVVGPEPATVELLERILGLDHLAIDEHYRLSDFDAFAHVAEVAAGLGSQILGEEHIRGQLKEALATAREAGWCNGMVDEWLAVVLEVAKAAGAQAATHLVKEEIEDRCASWLLDALSPGAMVAVIGHGTVGRGVLDRLPSALVGRGVGRDLTAADLTAVDAVVCATDTADCFDADLAGVLPTAAMVVDLGMPRNVDPAAATLLGDRLVDLDGLATWAAARDDRSAVALATARDTIAAHREVYDALMHRFQGGNAGE